MCQGFDFFPKRFFDWLTERKKRRTPQKPHMFNNKKKKKKDRKLCFSLVAMYDVFSFRFGQFLGFL
jgi:hypothetical protein